MQNRREAAARRRRRRRRWALLGMAVLLLLSPAVYSYTTTMLQPSSLPLGVRSVEWLRSHHGNWLVDEVEHFYYSAKAPKKGGPQLKRLPALGAAATATAGAHAKPWPVRIRPVFAHALPREGVWVPTGPPIDGRPPVLITTFRTELDYPRIVAYVAWFDHTRTALAFYPGRYEPPSAPVRGPMSVPHDQRWRLLATFNSGFIYADGHNGSTIGGRTYEPLKRGLATLVGYRNGRRRRHVLERWAERRTPDRLRPPEPAADRPERTAQPGPERQLAVGLHARERGPRLAHRRRHRPSRQRDLRRGQRPDRDHAGADPPASRSDPRNAVRHQSRVADPDRVPPLPRPRSRPRSCPTCSSHPRGTSVPDDRDFFAVYRRLPGPVTVPFK